MARAVFLSLLVLLPGSLFAANRFARTQVLMGNVPVTLTVEARASQRHAAFAAMGRAFTEARRLDRSLSEWRAGSQATLLNRYSGTALVPIDRDMTTLLLKARQISELTHGAFDITFPSKCRGQGATTCPTYRDVIVLSDWGLASLRPGVKIGVSGIAKGYIVDAMARILRRAGFKKFLVNGGDLYAAGRWTVGIRDPNRPGTARTTRMITVKNRAVSTSGQYERGPHIIDPRTRRPATGWKSVTVIARDSTTADALATAFFVLGKTASKKILKARPDLSAIFISQ